MSLQSALAQRPGVVRCQACPWAQDVATMDEGMAAFEQHTKTGHRENPATVGASFHITKHTTVPLEPRRELA